MEYIPGQIHESLQKIHFFEVSQYFVWSTCSGKRYRDFKDISDWDIYSEHHQLKPGDILLIRFFKHGQTAHCYLESMISDGVEVDFFTETFISRDFIEINTKVFTNITTIMRRDRKINQIINQ